MYTIQVVGAGYTGARIARFFAQKKQKVFALTRSAEKAETFQTEGIQPLIADLTRPETLREIPPAHFIVICPAPDESTDACYESVYLRGIQNYLSAIQKNPKPFLIVYLSSTGVWRDQTEAVLDESIEPRPQSAKARILAEAEKQILGCGMPAAILRLSGIYGPGRNRLKAFRAGEWPETGVDRWMNMIHVEDIAAALPDFFKKAQEEQVYVMTDDEPFLMSHLARWISQKLSLPRTFDWDALPPQGRKLKNTKFKNLGICLKYPSYREGYAQLIEEEGNHV